MKREVFDLQAPYVPSPDQEEAIKEIVKYINDWYKYQTLWGVTGSWKTFTMANVIKKINKPTLVIAHNKTLAAQLAQEFKEFFPNNSVHYFVSYYDYYQPEAYVAKTDTYIEKEATVNEEIDRLRHAATQDLLTRKDVIIVASVSCIYGIWDISLYMDSTIDLKVWAEYEIETILRKLVAIQYKRAYNDFKPWNFVIKWDILEIFPASSENVIMLEFWWNEITNISVRDHITNEVYEVLQSITIFPAKHTVTTTDRIAEIIPEIQKELDQRLAYFEKKWDVLRHERLKTKVEYDIEMMTEVGYVNGIENYSRYLDWRKAWEAPATLIDYFGDDFLCFVDESHMTFSQVAWMYAWDRSRKENLVENGFRLASALDNRPLRFFEFEKKLKSVVAVSATPWEYEIIKSCEMPWNSFKKDRFQYESILTQEDFLFIKNIFWDKAKNKEEYVVIKDSWKIIAFAALISLADDVMEFVDLWILDEYRWNKIWEKIFSFLLLTKYKIDTEVYIYASSLLKEYFEDIWFVVSEAIPAIFKEKKGFILMRYAKDLVPKREIPWEKFFNFDPLVNGVWKADKEHRVVPQMMRPTGLLDPEIILKPMEYMVDTIMALIDEVLEKNERMLITTITKRSSEELTDYLLENWVKVKYLHSEVETLDRLEILRELREGKIDLVVGVNLLREGLDLPEVSKICILDADKQWFLRSETSLIQIIWRAARNVSGKVYMFSEQLKKFDKEKYKKEEDGLYRIDKWKLATDEWLIVSESMRKAINLTYYRRWLQEEYNSLHNITPTTIFSNIKDTIAKSKTKDIDKSSKKTLDRELKRLELEMDIAATNLDFEKAAELRDLIIEIKRDLKK